ncbi:MAG: alcohol dehydrogenase catalytic domain-containing protein [Nanoarchaeota archaeon]|nr:alcohol dehydrogenase catalytic domain-containing protein [Nanoarchaeota archaeon]
MKAAVLTKVKKIEYKDVKVPQIGEDDVLIKVSETGICGSDLSTYQGTHPYKKPPIILGHEVCGFVDDLGGNVKDLNKGDKVCVESYSACEECIYCQDDKPNLCLDKKVAVSGDWQGSFAEYFKAPRNSVYKLSQNVSDSEGALIEPLAVALHALGLSNSIKGKNIAILGTGNIGLCSLICAQKLDAKEILCSDISNSKSKLAKKFGVDYFVDVSKDNLVNYVRNIFKDGVDTTIVAADYPSAIDEATEITKRAGEIITVSYFEKKLEAQWNKIVRKEITLKGSAVSCKKDFLTIIKWLETKEIDPTPMISHRFPLEKAGKAMKQMIKNSGKIILYP